ncbi:hypothetical protein C1878_00010 [Gordonibacter sp. 28C]|uniref:AAA family ATPase n=1 Tax=Gordonibacter sp. 28C TaxID=2078569 RepID=UPI000DF75AE6|nr:AAA family ATPase [Gordonibacter sp. 28C]RDB64293.1 hypothetical protein C1878_00010 [Gordonibacter sp. 28C]
MQDREDELGKQIKKWLRSQPPWYSHALHLSIRGLASEAEINTLAGKACIEAGVNVNIAQRGVELEGFQEEDLALLGTSGREVILTAITAEKGVNALTENSTLTFETDGLTVVYGENGSGKSGFCRLIRNACTSRAGAEDILSNVFAPSEKPVAIYRAIVDGGSFAFRWTSGETECASFPEVMFFDSACAALEIEGRQNEVLYTPPILGAFERLSQLVSIVSDTLKRYADNLPTLITASLLPDFAKTDPSVASLLASSDPEAALRVFEKIELSEPEIERLELLPELIKADPNVELPILQRRFDQLSNLREQLAALYRHCEAKFQQEYATAVQERDRAWIAVNAARKLLSDSSELKDVGGDDWRALWESARTYSNDHAYSTEAFPFVGEGAICPLCQQPLSQEAGHRLTSFEKYVTSAAETVYQNKAAALTSLERAFLNAARNVIDEKAGIAIIESGEARDAMDRLIDKLNSIEAFPGSETLAELLESTKGIGKSVRRAMDGLSRKMSSLKEHLKPDSLARMQAEYRSLQSRRWAMQNRQQLLADVTNRYTKNGLERVRKDCTTRSITAFVSEISRSEVVGRMQASFTQELTELNAEGQPVSFGAKTKAGREIQEIALVGAIDNLKAAKVLSEGERKIIALAGFFAQVDVMPSQSTIVLDDPVTSLDHKWRESVACRIVDEARKRPVVVFTHDPRFCSYLTIHAEQREAGIEYRTVRRKGNASGVIVDGLDWGACRTKQRVIILQEEADALKAKQKSGDFEDDSVLDREIHTCYGRLRSAWERAVEEVLLAGVIERMSPPVHTQLLKKISDIDANDIAVVDQNMSKCSTVIDAHDDPMAAPVRCPTVEDLISDIDALRRWMKSINKRRGN